MQRQAFAPAQYATPPSRRDDIAGTRIANTRPNHIRRKRSLPHLTGFLRDVKGPPSWHMPSNERSQQKKKPDFAVRL